MDPSEPPTARAEAPGTTVSTSQASAEAPPRSPEVAPGDEVVVSEQRPPGRGASTVWRAFRMLAALFFFVLALQLMKTGASGLSILNEGGFLVRNPGSTLGLGWLGALFVLSGSPVAATSLTLVKAESITEVQGFTMLTGSRLGAAFVVLLVAVIYALRGGAGERLKPVSTAVMALVTTAVIYIPGATIGLLLLYWGPFKALDLRFPAQFDSLVDLVYDPILTRVEDFPAPLLFLGGLAILLLTFKLIDTVMPQISEETITSSKMSWLKKKWPMFALGSLVALITFSVSVALTVLVPLVVKGYVKREAIVPYIMGANITTLGDTMLAAFLLGSPAAVRIVLAEVIGTTIISVLLLAFFYPQVRRGIWKFQRQVVKSRPRLAMFTAALFVTPIAIIGIAGTFG
jgi:solute carrier family 34 (sodium-dependent phosphate cotransporter)